MAIEKNCDSILKRITQNIIYDYATGYYTEYLN